MQCEFFHSVCVDVDILLHVICFCGIHFIIKNLQENVSKNENKFRRSRPDTFQVCLLYENKTKIIIIS